MIMYWIKTTQTFCEDNAGYLNGNGQFGYAVTISGEYVCAIQSLIDFPEIFIGCTIDIVTRGYDDFAHDDED